MRIGVVSRTERMNIVLQIMDKSTTENLIDLAVAVRSLEKRLSSPMYGPMLQDDPDDLCS